MMIPMRVEVLALLVATVALAGCVTSDEPPNVETTAPAAEPVTTFELPDPITGLDPVAALDLGGGGNGIWIDEARNLLYSTNGGAGFFVVDISDPENPVQISDLPAVGSARDVDMLEWDNRTFAVLASGGIDLVDVTDPYNPFLVWEGDGYGAHNVASVPGTPYIYDSSGFAPEKLIPVLDITVPEDPVWHVIEIPLTVNSLPVQSDGCHDITVRVDLGMAYCAGGGTFYVAGGGETLIMDISKDPLNPEFIGHIDNPSIVYHHQALASEDGKFLYIDDEHIIVDNCQGADVPGLGSRGQTTGAMWIYDISDPALPVMRSWVQPMVVASPNCGSHFGDLVDGAGMVVFGWYSGGTILIDVSNPDEPRVVDQLAPSGSTWDARYHNGHVYGSANSLDVLRLV